MMMMERNKSKAVNALHVLLFDGDVISVAHIVTVPVDDVHE